MKRKLYKLMSIVLSVCILLSVCGVTSLFSTIADTKITDYYVGYSTTSDGSGTSVENPVPSVEEAIEKINENGLTAEDTANIWIVQDIASPQKIASGVTNKPYHNLAYWSADGSVSTHEAKIVIKPHADNQTVNTSLETTYLVMAQRISDQYTIVLGGPTEIENLKIVYTSSSNVKDGVTSSTGQSHIIANGYDLTIGNGITYGYINHNGLNGDNWNGAIADIKSLGVALAADGGTFEKPIYLGLKTPWDPHDNAVEIPALDNRSVNEYTFKEDVTVEVENPEIYNGYIRIGSYEGGSSTFEKNLNFKLGNIGQIRFKSGAKKAVIKGGVQFIAKSTLSFDDGYSYTDVTAWVKEDGSTLADIWYLKVAAADLDYINFMNGTTGKFKVATGLQATATPEAGGEAVVSQNGVLDLSGKPGVYTLAFEAAAATSYDYYVGFGGVNYNETDEYGVVGTVDAPYASISDAIKALKANGIADTEGNTVNIYIVQDIAAPTKVPSGVTNKPYHNLAYWGEYVEYNANVIIQPYEENQKVNTSLTTTYLAMDRQVSAQSVIKLGGPTEFRNLKIVYCSSSNVTEVSASSGKTHIIANGHNLIMGEGVSYGYIAHNGNNGDNWQGVITDIKSLGVSVAEGSATFEKPIYLGFKNIWDAHNNAVEIPALDNKTTSEYTFKEDVTVEVNNSNMYSGYIRVGSYAGGSSTFEKNLNFKLTNINKIRFKNGAKNAVVKGGVQFIVPNNQSYESGYDYTVLTKLVKADGTTPADLWYLNVDKADMSKINFINGETGKFAIAEGFTATATPKAGGTDISSYNGVLDLSGKKGEYTITFEEGGGSVTPPPAVSSKMLYFKGDARGPFYQRVENLTPNATYTLKFALSNISPNFEVVVQTNGSRNSIDATTSLVNADNKGKYTVYEYSVTLPSQITIENGQETNTAFVGIRFAQSDEIEGYIFDISLKDANSTEKYKNGDFAEGYLDNWAWGWNKWFNSTAYGVSNGTFTHSTEGDIYLEVMDFDESKIPDYEPPYIPSQNKKMLYFKGTKRGPLYQRLENLTPGGTYTFTFEASNNLEGLEVVAHKNSSRTKLTVQSTLVNAVDKGRYTVYEYSVTLPSELTVENGVETNMAFIGIRFDAASVEEGGYITDLSFTDANGKEYFKNGDFFGGYLDNWAWDWNIWFNSNKYGEHKGTFTHSDSLGSSEIYLEVMDFDENKMPVVEPPYVPSQNDKMLYFKGTKRGPLYQRLENLTPGGTYTLKFALSNNVTGVEVAAARNTNRANLSVNATLTKLNPKGRYTEYEYSVTLPSELTVENGVETNMAFIGIKFDAASVEEGAYITDLSFTDANGKEYFKNGDFFGGYLDNWAWDWNVWFNSNKYGVHKGTFEHTNDFGATEIYLEVMDFDESKMKDVEPPYVPTPGDKMLYFKGTKRGPLYQRLENLKPNGTYILTFDASNNITGIEPVAAKNSSRSGLTLKSTYIDGVDHGRYSTYTYEITLPSELTVEGGVETNMAFIGVTFSQPSTAEGGYITNLSLKEKIDENKLGEELYKNGDFHKGYLDYWAWEWNIWFNSNNFGKYKGTFAHSNQYGATEIYLEVMDFDESKMPNVKAKLPDYSRKMIYFKNGAITNQFAAWVDSKPNMKYIIKYSVFATEEITPSLNANGMRGKLDTSAKLLSEVKESNYTTYTYEVTVPETYTDNLVFLGVSMPYYAEGYLFDLEAWRADDPEKKDIWDNEGFVKGFDDWIWGWTVTWFSKEGTGNLTEWSDATHDIRLMKFDLSNIDKLINDIYRDDGEWWKPDDVVEEEEVKGIANVSGTFKDHNGNAVAGLKLVFKSENNKYTATTDANGAFSFKNVAEGYYELYFVNSAGEEVLSEFYCTLFNGDELTVNIVTDTTQEVKTGTLKGAVYTPELKTVANIKLYLRGVAETTTDKDGSFDFGEIAVGKYDLYTILEDGSEYVFRTVEIKENTDLAVKLKYDVETSSDDVVEEEEEEEGIPSWIWIVVACGEVVLVAAVVIIIVVAKKKKSQK